MARGMSLVVLLLTLAGSAAHADVAPDSVRIRHLATAGRLWSAAEIFHPATAARPGAWDSAFVRAVPAIRAARTTDEFSAALDSMFAELHDPATHVMRPDLSWAPSPKDPDPRWRWLDGGVLVVRANNGADFFAAGFAARLDSVALQVATARAVVLDLRRFSGRTPYAPDYSWGQSGFDGVLVRERVFGPASRSRAHVGWRGYRGTAGMYGSYWRTTDGLRQSPDSAGAPLRLVVLVNADAWIPASVLGLQARGTAAIVCEGAFSDAPFAGTALLPFAPSRYLQLRTAELVLSDGSAPHADTTLAASADTAVALNTAIALARRASPLPRRIVPASAELPLARPSTESYAAMREPSLPWRLLAAARIWSRIEYWEAYRHLLGDRWDRAYEQAIPSFESAEDSTAYALAVARFYAHVEDTHGFVRGVALSKFIGEAKPPVEVRMIEGVPVVTALEDTVAARLAGFEVGDVVLSVDGIAASERIELMRGLRSVSNREQGDYAAATVLLSGPDSSTAVVSVRDGRGRTVERRAVRAAWWPHEARYYRSGPVWKVLPGNLGYVDLERLRVMDVDTMFAALAGTRGIVFDNRSYPQGTAWTIAPRLTEREHVVAARFQTPIATHPREDQGRYTDEQEVFDQKLPPARGSRYLKPTVMLVDERTISQAEHTGLFLEAANGTTFVGSRTAGANGDITAFAIPGGISLSFTGHDVRHADGRQLQQVGLPLAVNVRPTIAGLRAGRDEVLEAGVRHLEARIAAAAKKAR